MLKHRVASCTSEIKATSRQRRAVLTREPRRRTLVQTLDDMSTRSLVTPAQHCQMAAWIARSKTPEAILQMPARLWRTLALASVLMDVDADLTQPPLLGEGS